MHWILQHWFSISMISFLLFFLWILVEPWGDDPMGR